MPAAPKLTTTRSPSVVGEELAYQSRVQFCSLSGYSMSFCQRILPSLRSRQRRLRRLPSFLAMVRKILPFQTIGVELPCSARVIFHLTFSVALQFRGRLVS